MAYVTYDAYFWDEVSLAFKEQFEIADFDECELIDRKALYLLAREVSLGCNEEGTCFIGNEVWTPEYTADRLHRRLSLR